jgi:hypothetical protein
MLTLPLVFPLKWTKNYEMMKLLLGFLKKNSIYFNGKIDEMLTLQVFEISGVDCYFLNFGVKIEKPLKPHGLKLHFPLYSTTIK